MTRFAVDAGPLVALLNPRDAHHRWAKETLDIIAPPLLTCEAVISESCFLVRQIRGCPAAVVELVTRGILQLATPLATDSAAIGKLLAKYEDVPMSLADACLVRMTERDAQLSVITLDADFRIYRRNGRQSIPLVMP